MVRRGTLSEILAQRHGDAELNVAGISLDGPASLHEIIGYDRLWPTGPMTK